MERESGGRRPPVAAVVCETAIPHAHSLTRTLPYSLTPHAEYTKYALAALKEDSPDRAAQFLKSALATLGR